jgi:hypothetical protein
MARMTPLLESRPELVQGGLVIGGPAVFGLLTGFLLGHSKLAYLLATLLSIPGGFLAGFEHAGGSDGADRGLVGGTLFGLFILLGHEIDGSAATTSLPHPAGMLVVFTAIFGALLGGLGGYLRGRAESGVRQES